MFYCHGNKIPCFIIIIIIIIYSAIHKKYNDENMSKQTLRECHL